MENKTTRVFTVEVSMCDECPDCGKTNPRCILKEYPSNYTTYDENFNELTPSCPRYAESIIKEVKE